MNDPEPIISAEQLRGIRIHEAAHAVIAHLIGGKVNGITCGGDRGRVDCRFGDRGGQLVAMAGAVASIFANAVGLETIDATSALSDDDKEMLMGPMLRIAAEDRQTTAETLGRVSTMTARIVKDAWPAIVALERSLELVPEMTGEMATQIIDGAGIPLTPAILLGKNWAGRETESEIKSRPLRDAIDQLYETIEATIKAGLPAEGSSDEN